MELFYIAKIKKLDNWILWITNEEMLTLLIITVSDMIVCEVCSLLQTLTCAKKSKKIRQDTCHPCGFVYHLRCISYVILWFVFCSRFFHDNELLNLGIYNRKVTLFVSCSTRHAHEPHQSQQTQQTKFQSQSYGTHYQCGRSSCLKCSSCKYQQLFLTTPCPHQ